MNGKHPLVRAVRRAIRAWPCAAALAVLLFAPFVQAVPGPFVEPRTIWMTGGCPDYPLPRDTAPAVSRISADVSGRRHTPRERGWMCDTAGAVSQANNVREYRKLRCVGFHRTQLVREDRI